MPVNEFENNKHTTMNLKKLLFIAVLFFSLGSVLAQNWISINSQLPTDAKVELISGDISNSIVKVELGGFMLNPVTTQNGNAFTIGVGESTPILEKGMPDLPKVTTSLIIPDDAGMELNIISSKFKDFNDINIAPSKGNFTRDINPSDVPYIYGSAYTRNEFFPSEIGFLRDPFIIRDHRGQSVVISPFAYNPVTKVLRVYYEIVLEVKATGISTINTLSRNSSNQESIDFDFKQIYDRHFLNSATVSRYTPLEEQGNLLIISYGPFMPAMQDFVNWKRTIGTPTEIVDVAVIGANSTAIKSYVADYYAANGLTYLLLVGDHAQVPTVTTGSIGGPSDHAYGFLAGSDHNPDIFVGRFSGELESHIVTQVQRTITYEQNPIVSYDWFSKGVGIASAEGPGDDNEYDWQHMRNIRTDLINYTYTTVAELYDGSQGGEDQPGNPNSASVSTEVNDGRSIINYVGHGSQNSWSTTGFSNSGVNQLTNNDKWPFIFSVACVNGDFLNSTCFAEAWLRANNTNGPTGAIAALMSTINQSWNPPMDGQDEMNDILVESYESNIKRTFGGVSINGCIKMNETYGSAGEEMTDTWLIFGDPSLMLRTALPTQLAVTHSNVAFIGSNQFEINCSVNDAVACLTMNGDIIGTATVSGGTAIINIPNLTQVGIMKLAVTAYNHLPYISDIEIIPLEGPYIVYDNNEINDVNGNNNMQLDYNETITFALGLKNAGTEDVANVTVTIQCNDPYIILNDTTELYPLISAGQVTSIADGFGLTVSNDVPEGYQINLSFLAVADTNQWEGVFVITAHSVVLNYAGIIINDSEGNNNGKVDAGETVFLNLRILNAGTAPAYDVLGVISTDDPYLLINVDSVYTDTVVGYEIVNAVFTVTALPTTPTGHQVVLDFDISALGGFTGSGSPSFIVGQIPVLVIDIDGNKNSGPAIRTSLSNIGITTDYVTSWPMIIGPYQSVFVCLGSYPNNTVLTSGQGQALANFMNNNYGKVYMEGGDTWAYNNPTPAHPMFKIDGDGDGGNDLSIINGVTGTFTEGMSFTFYGDNNYIDHLLPIDDAFVVLQNTSPEYNTTIAYDGGTYRTIGSSCEFGGINSGTGISHKDSLMSQYVNFLGITNSTSLLANFIASEVKICEMDEVVFTDYSAGNITSWEWSFPGGNPETSIEQNPAVIYRLAGNYDVSLTVSDGTNSYTTTKTAYIDVDICSAARDEYLSKLLMYPNPANNNFTLVLPDNRGETLVGLYTISGVEVQKEITSGSELKMDVKNLQPGLYFVKVSSNQYNETLKLIITR
jgi:PKD repeat protein